MPSDALLNLGGDRFGSDKVGISRLMLWQKTGLTTTATTTCFFHSKADESCSCLHAMNRRPSKHYTPGWPPPPPPQQQQQQQPKKKKNMSGTRGIMTYQHEQIYITWEFVGNMWETNGKSTLPGCWVIPTRRATGPAPHQTKACQTPRANLG